MPSTEIHTHTIRLGDGSLVQVPDAPLHEIHPLDPITRRQMAYRVDEQLNALHDDIAAGLFGEAAKTGKFMEYVSSIKAQFPRTD